MEGPWCVYTYCKAFLPEQDAEMVREEYCTTRKAWQNTMSV